MNLTEELEKLNEEMSHLDDRRSEIIKRKNEIEYEMTIAGPDPLEDKWFIAYGVGRPNIVFYSKRSPDAKTKYSNIQILNRKDIRA